MNKACRFCIVLFICIDTVLPGIVKAQGISRFYSFDSYHQIQRYYYEKTNQELSTGIFVKKEASGTFLNHDIARYWVPVSSAPNPIDAPGTPKTAIFCRFENTLWRRLGFGVKLRVENPDNGY